MKPPATDTIERIAAALDWVERNLGAKITVADVARRACYSPFHFHRMFTGLTGEPLMDFVRRRRLTTAARWLRETDRSILEIAFDSGFDSQEAFTRAFKKTCGTTPGRYRRAPQDSSIPSTGRLDAATLSSLCGGRRMQPEFVDLPAFEVVGLQGRFTIGQTAGIPRLWEAFVRRWSQAGKPFPQVSYGVCYDESEGADQESVPFTYVAAFPTDAREDVPEDLERRSIPANHYAVFTHSGRIMDIKDTYAEIFGTWLPPSGYRRGTGPDFERYDERFDEATMTGEVDIYLPVERLKG